MTYAPQNEAYEGCGYGDPCSMGDQESEAEIGIVGVRVPPVECPW